MTNQYTYNPPFTAEELANCYYGQNMSQHEIASHFNTTQKTVWRAMKKLEMPTRRQVARNQKGESNNNWRGGRVLSAIRPGKMPFGDNGYWYVYAPNHPNANKSGYVAEHIAVATEIAGRHLIKGECVHHIDLNKQNNGRENVIIATRSEHAMWHQQLARIAVSLIAQGRVVFTPQNGYEWAI